MAGEIGDYYLKLAKLKGEFLWHKHDTEDEMFLVVAGRLVIKLRDGDVELLPGEFLIIPHGDRPHAGGRRRGARGPV